MERRQSTFKLWDGHSLIDQRKRPTGALRETSWLLSWIGIDHGSKKTSSGGRHEQGRRVPANSARARFQRH